MNITLGTTLTNSKALSVEILNNGKLIVNNFKGYIMTKCKVCRKVILEDRKKSSSICSLICARKDK